MERKKGTRPVWKSAVALGALLAAAAVMTLALWWASQRSGPRPSGRLEQNAVTEEQGAALEKLCRVWGLAKYYHPALAAGEKDWDQALLELIPEVLSAPGEAADSLLLTWVESLGERPEGTPPEPPVYRDEDGDTVILTGETALEPETGWMASLSPPLSAGLKPLLKTYVTDRDKGPAVTVEGGYISFHNERAYRDMDFRDARMRLLSLFRYWNIIQYYFPYRDIMEEDWDAVLTEFIPKFLAAEDSLSYKLAVLELTSRIHDSHAATMDQGYELYRFWGDRRAPVTFLQVDGEIVIEAEKGSNRAECPLEPGDIVKKLDGKDIADVVAEKSKYLSFSSDDRIVNNLSFYLFSTEKSSMIFTVERDGQTMEFPVNCYRSGNADPPARSHQLLEGNIGLINPGALKKGEIHQIMKEFQNTAGLIVDLRQYPSDFLVFSLAEYLMPHPGPFARFTFSAPGVPGRFNVTEPMVNGKENPDYYKGKVILLMDECTQSQAEYTVMALRRAPTATVAGSNSIGADGNVISFTLPGGIETGITGLGVFYPDGTPTQRVGLSPDVEVRPTVEGLRAGRDEVLEAAIKLIP